MQLAESGFVGAPLQKHEKIDATTLMLVKKGARLCE